MRIFGYTSLKYPLKHSSVLPKRKQGPDDETAPRVQAPTLKEITTRKLSEITLGVLFSKKKKKTPKRTIREIQDFLPRTEDERYSATTETQASGSAGNVAGTSLSFGVISLRRLRKEILTRNESMLRRKKKEKKKRVLSEKT